MVEAARPIPHQLSHGCDATLIEATDGVEAPNEIAARGPRCGRTRDTSPGFSRDRSAVHERDFPSFGQWSWLVDPDSQSA